MRHYASVIVSLAFSLAGCGSGDPGSAGTPRAKSSSGSPGKASAATTNTQNGAEGTFSPPPLQADFTRFSPPTLSGIAPGSDETHCYYVMAAADHDEDIVSVQGTQSAFGHHAVAFSYAPAADAVVGSEVKCMMGNNEFSASTSTDSAAAASTGGYLGAVGPRGNTVTLPDGVVYRLKKGQGVLLNVHYINTSDAPVDGDTYIDMKLVDADPSRLVASLFLNLNGGFSVPPKGQTTSRADCVAQSDVKIIMMSNHMHEWGTSAVTDVVRGDTGAVDVLHDDKTWTSDMVSNPDFSKWTVDAPFVLHTDDTIRTSCTWANTSTETLTFPREMCISAGFALTTGSNPAAPACFNGTWIAMAP